MGWHRTNPHIPSVTAFFVACYLHSQHLAPILICGNWEARATIQMAFELAMHLPGSYNGLARTYLKPG